jgi:hypothetical protein
LKETDVSEVHTASIIRAMNKPRARIVGYIEIGGPSETWAGQWEMGDSQVRKQTSGRQGVGHSGGERGIV